MLLPGLSKMEQKIFGELYRRIPGRVSTVKLGKVSGSYATSSVVSKLRKKLNKYGFDIGCEVANDPNKKYYYFFVIYESL